jgi:phosphoribosylformylglycinamidine synthase
MKAKVYVSLKKGILDPQGKAIQNALQVLGHSKVREVRVGKYIELDLDGIPAEEARRRLTEMCEKLLANPVIEDYRFEVG